MFEAVASIDLNGGLGYKGELLLSTVADMKRFREITVGRTVIMGRKTFESLPSVLSNRHHLVVTHSDRGTIEGDCVTYTDNPVRDAPADSIVVGGAEIFNMMREHISVLHLTVFDWQCKDVDTWLPEWMYEGVATPACDNFHTFKEIRYVR